MAHQMEYCDCCGAGVLEIKCLYCHRTDTIVDAACEDKLAAIWREFFLMRSSGSRVLVVPSISFVFVFYLSWSEDGTPGQLIQDIKTNINQEV